MKRIAINENGIHMVFEVRRDKVRLMHFSALPLDENTLVRQGEKDLYFPSEIQVTGRNRPSNWHGAKIVETSPGYEMKYLDFRDSRNDTGRKLEWETVHEETGLHLTMHYQFYDGIPVVHSWTEVTNCGTEAQGLEALSSFCLMGLGKEGNALEQIQLFRSGLDLHGRFRSGSRIDAGLFGEQYGQLVYQGVSSDGVSRGYGSRRIALLADRT